MLRKVEDILQAHLSREDGILVARIDRLDLSGVKLEGVPIAPALDIGGGRRSRLYYVHAFKKGDVWQLAREIRAGLDQTHAKFNAG